MLPCNRSSGESRSDGDSLNFMAIKRQETNRSATRSEELNRGLNRKHLNLKEIQRLMRFSFEPRKQLDGRYTGRHASPERGQSVEFRDYREYMPGDEVGHVDWKVYGRTDKLFVRLFEHETELTLHLLVDGSNSMDYDRHTDERKFDHACRLAAAIAFVVMHAKDRVGFGISRRGLIDYQRPSSAIPQLVEMLDSMQHRQPRGEALLNKAMLEVADRMSRGQIMIVFSDLWEELDGVFEAAAKINHLGGELILFHVLHRDEVSLPHWEQVILRDSENGAELSINADAVRLQYQQRLQRRFEEVRAKCRQFDVQYQFAPTSEPHYKTLERFLRRRVS